MRKGERPGGARAGRVLVVDDEPDIRELLELTLVKMGLGVDTAGSVAEARETLKETRFDLCLTDMRLPDGDGLELVRHIAGLSRCLSAKCAAISARRASANGHVHASTTRSSVRTR